MVYFKYSKRQLQLQPKEEIIKGDIMNTYFKPIPQTSEELKKLYRTLAMEHHPDRGGNDEVMKAINNEFDELYKKLKDIHTTATGETYTAKKESTETAQAWRETLGAIIHLEGVIIEIVGSFIWLTGNTYIHKDIIKSQGFKFSSKKVAWYKAPENYKKSSNKQFTLDELKNLFGSQTVNTEQQARIATT